MVKPKWYTKSIQQTLTETGYIITITTNTPCHLWMRWTTKPYRMHLRPTITRGITTLFIPYYCFTVYKDNEQTESGDTLEHTFVKEPWPGCETRYFYFWGTIATKKSPSSSAVYIKHRPLAYILILAEPWQVDYTPPSMTKILTEPWQVNYEPPDMQDFIEPWQVDYTPPNMVKLLTEPWSVDFTPPNMTLILSEDWP